MDNTVPNFFGMSDSNSRIDPKDRECIQNIAKEVRNFIEHNNWLQKADRLEILARLQQVEGEMRVEFTEYNLSEARIQMTFPEFFFSEFMRQLADFVGSRVEPEDGYSDQLLELARNCADGIDRLLPINPDSQFYKE